MSKYGYRKAESGARRWQKFDTATGEPVGPSFYASVKPGPRALPPCKGGKVPANGREAREALSAAFAARVIGGWWHTGPEHTAPGKKKTDTRWQIATAWDTPWPTETNPDPEGCVRMADAEVVAAYGQYVETAPEAPAKKRRKGETRRKGGPISNVEPVAVEPEPVTVRADVTALCHPTDTPETVRDRERTAALARPEPDRARDLVREYVRTGKRPEAFPGSAVETASPDTLPAPVLDWLDRLAYPAKRDYAAAYCRAVLAGEALPADPGTGWADKARRRADRVLAGVLTPA